MLGGEPEIVFLEEEATNKKDAKNKLCLNLCKKLYKLGYLPAYREACRSTPDDSHTVKVRINHNIQKDIDALLTKVHLVKLFFNNKNLK